MSLADKFIKTAKKEIKGAGLLANIVDKPKELLDTGIPALNLAYSGDLLGGTHYGVSCIAGKSKSFKTLFGLISAKSYMDKYTDSYMIFYDSEGGASKEYFESVGIDINRVIYIPIMNIEELKFDLVTKLEEIKEHYKETKEYSRFVIFIDSIGNLASIKELDDAKKGSSAVDMGTRAKALKALFRMITPYFVNYEMHMIAIMHTYDEMASMGAPKQIMSGGCLVSGSKVIMGDGSILEIENISPGDEVMTRFGPKKVLYSWDKDTLEIGEPECIEIEFEDGRKIICSENHPFLTKNEDGLEVWVQAKDITLNQELLSI